VAHTTQVNTTHKETQCKLLNKHELTAAEIKSGAPHLQARQMGRSANTGAWLMAIPNLLNGTKLLIEEFRDNACIQLGLIPIAPFT
jgi:hypothetical protein